MDVEHIVITNADRADEPPRRLGRWLNASFVGLFAALALWLCVSGRIWSHSAGDIAKLLLVIIPGAILYALSGLLLFELALLGLARGLARRLARLPESWRAPRVVAIPFAPRLRPRGWMWMILGIAVAGLTASREGLLVDAATLELTLSYDNGSRYLFTPTQLAMEGREEARAFAGSFVDCHVTCAREGELCESLRASLRCDSDRRAPRTDERVTRVEISVRDDGGSCWPIPLVKSGTAALEWSALLRGDDGTTETIEGRGHVWRGPILGVHACRTVRCSMGTISAQEIARVLRSAVGTGG